MTEIRLLLQWLDGQSCGRHTGRAPGCEDCATYGEVARLLDNLHTALIRYSEHGYRCASRQPGYPPCTCGLDAAIRGKFDR